MKVGKIESTSGSMKITKEHVDAAFKELQKDDFTVVFSVLPVQLKMACTALLRISYLTDEQWHSTSTLYSQFNNCVLGSNPEDWLKLSYRRFSQLLNELESCGIAESVRRSKGRHGYGAEYKLTSPPELIAALFAGQDWWDELVEMKRQRMDFLWTKSFQKAKKDFEKYGDASQDSVVTQMNDRTWNITLHGYDKCTK